MPESHAIRKTKHSPTARSTRANPDALQAQRPWRMGLLLHFFAHLGLAADADAALAERGFGRVHHRILYFAHFAPGISVGELLGVLRMSHQNAQRALRQLDQEGLIEFKLSKQDRRLKLLHCTPKGEQLIAALTTRQQERITRAYEACTPRDIEGFLAVLGKMIDADDLQWLDRLVAAKD